MANEVKLCPMCESEKIPQIKTDIRTFIYKNKAISGPYNFYYCEDCGQGFTTDSLEQGNIDRIKSKAGFRIIGL